MTDKEALQNIFLRPIVLLGSGIVALNRKLDEKFPSRRVPATAEQTDAVLARFAAGGLAAAVLGLLWWFCAPTVKENRLLSEFWWNVVGWGSFLLVVGGMAIAAAALRMHAIASSMKPVADRQPNNRKEGSP